MKVIKRNTSVYYILEGSIVPMSITVVIIEYNNLQKPEESEK